MARSPPAAIAVLRLYKAVTAKPAIF